MKHILVVGAGSVGGFFGAKLAKHDPNVSFLLRPKTLEVVKHRGLTIRSTDGSFTVRPPASSDARDLPTPDLIVLGVRKAATFPGHLPPATAYKVVCQARCPVLTVRG